jgi:hypothetical protein
MKAGAEHILNWHDVWKIEDILTSNLGERLEHIHKLILWLGKSPR